MCTELESSLNNNLNNTSGFKRQARGIFLGYKRGTFSLQYTPFLTAAHHLNNHAKRLV